LPGGSGFLQNGGPHFRKPGVIDAHSLAALALANRLSLDFSPHGRNNVSADFRAEISLHALPPAERTFHYAWDSCWADIGILRRLVVLTLLSSSLMLAYGITTILTEISNQKLGVGVLSGSIAEVLAFFVLGNLVCVILYAVSSFYEGALMRRRLRWDYFCATIKDQPTAE